MMLELVMATALQTPPAATAAQAQREGQAALESMTAIFTRLGSCERHFTPEQVRGVRRALEPTPGQAPTALQAHLEAAYQRGKQDTSSSAALCQAVLGVLAEQRGAQGRQ